MIKPIRPPIRPIRPQIRPLIRPIRPPIRQIRPPIRPIRQKDTGTKTLKKYLWSVVLHLRDVYVLVNGGSL